MFNPYVCMCAVSVCMYVCMACGFRVSEYVRMHMCENVCIYSALSVRRIRRKKSKLNYIKNRKLTRIFIVIE